MSFLDPVLARGALSLTTIAAFPAGKDRLMLAIDALDKAEDKPSASAILGITLGKKLSIERLHETDVSAIDYAYEDGWHGLLRRDGIDQISGEATTFTKVPLGEKGALTRLARSGGTVYACGRAADGVDGFIGCVDGTQWKHVAAMSEGYTPGTFEALHFPTPARGYAVGSWGALFTGNAQGFAPVKLPDLAFSTDGQDATRRHSMRAVHAKADGTVLLAGRGFAAIYANGTVTKVGGDHAVRNRYVDSVAEYRGVEYWAMENRMADRLELATHEDTELTPVFATGKYKPINYRREPHAGARITVRDDLMVVTNIDRIHIFDGATWTSLKLQPDPAQLVKRIPTGMKPV